MNDAHLHLVLNHLPIIIPAVGLLIMIIGLVFRSEIVKRTAYFVFILGAIAAFAAFSTGEGAEEIVEKLPGINENTIKIHEEIAEQFSILCYVLGGIALVGLYANFYKKTYSKGLTYLAIIITLATIYYAAQTGTTGGEIRHTEIRTNTVTKATSAETNEKEE